MSKEEELWFRAQIINEQKAEIKRLRSDVEECATNNERLQTDLDKAETTEHCYEVSFDNLCIHAGVDLGYSRDMREETLSDMLAATTEANAEVETLADRPLDDDLNVLVNRCVNREPLSLAEQRELWEWLEERDIIIGDYDEEIDRLREALAGFEAGAQAEAAAGDEARAEVKTTGTCPRCSECRGRTHHWAADN